MTTTTDFPAWALRSDRTIPRLHTPRLSSLDTHTLSNLRPTATFLVIRPLIGVALFVTTASLGWWPLLLPLSWLIYGSTIAAVHHLIHGTLGLSHRARAFWLSALGVVVSESGHALQVTHLLHHRTTPGLPDPEGYIENVTWRQTPIAALKFRYRLGLWGLRHSPRPGRVRAELAAHASLHLLSLALLPINSWLWQYLSLTHFASFAFAVLAGKGPHTNWGRKVSSPLIRVHTRLGRILLFSHDQHLEHHAYPKVPLSNLRDFHRHIDPTLEGAEVLDVRMAL